MGLHYYCYNFFLYFVYQVLLKAVQWFCRCGWSKIALSHYFGHWLIQQLYTIYRKAVMTLILALDLLT